MFVRIYVDLTGLVLGVDIGFIKIATKKFHYSFQGIGSWQFTNAYT
jgi:hypothetical protein